MNIKEMSPTELRREVKRVRKRYAPLLSAHHDQIIAQRSREWDMSPQSIIEVAIRHGLENMKHEEDDQ